MTQLITSILILLSAFTSLIQAQAQGKASPSPSPSPKPLPFCLSKDIRQMNVTGCQCEGHHDGCKANCNICGLPITDRYTLNPGCTVGCTDADKECKGCGLWFSTLCTCLKYDDCKKHGTYSSKEKDAVFVLTNTGERLITTTDELPGILEMAKNPDRYEPGWKFAQDNYDKGTEALALNSVRVRTHEQFHIHVCEKPDAKSKDPRILGIVDNIPVKEHIYGAELKQVPGQRDLWCRTIEKTQPDFVAKFIESIQGVLPKLKCDGFAGAGIIRDSHLNLWACVTNNTGGPLNYFCKKK